MATWNQTKKQLQLNLIKPIIFTLLVLFFSCTSNENPTNKDKPTIAKDSNSKDQKLYNLIREKDSLLFQIGFNKIDTLQVENLISTDFEFYHDEHGVTESKSDFVNQIESIRALPFKTWRTLVEMEVFPLYQNNSEELYGAIQNGVHDFYQQKDGEKAVKTNTAKFAHLWIIENGDWKLKRVLSFDHQVPE